MPYIKQESRPQLDEIIDQFHDGLSAGELAYIIYRLMLRSTVGGTYATFAAFVGTVFLTLLEYHQRVVAPYERQKATDNGDVTA